MFDDVADFSSTFALDHMVSEILAKTHMHNHDFETMINKEANDCEEPRAPALDVSGTFHLQVKKQTIISSKLTHN